MNELKDSNDVSLKNQILTFLGWIIGGFFVFMGIFGIFINFFPGLLFLTIGLSMFPPALVIINKKLGSKLTVSKKLLIILFFLIIALIFSDDSTNTTKVNNNNLIQTSNKETPIKNEKIIEKTDNIKLKLTSPDNSNKTVESSTFEIKGSVANSEIKVVLLKNENEIILPVDDNGKFSKIIDLDYNKNEITISGTINEEEVTKSITITRNKSQEELNTELKSKAKTIPYKDLFRNIDDYKNSKIHYTGKVIQVIGDGKFLSQLRVNITKGNYGIWDDTILITISDLDAPKILDDDIIEFWGYVEGEVSYETVMGSTMTIPSVTASILELK